ncbi:MAG: glycosyltransferase family 2 protein, partial [Candidatus Omnitrophica bacterium]|nr:glycosyltransferase family 2 protein [Candidatus Omnitrophota bacterium]
MNKGVSIIIPAYNCAAYIVATVESALNQTYSDVEVLVIDDGSKDNTRELLEAYKDKLTYIFQYNQGESVARNNGLKLAKGEYIVFLDSDDILEKTMIEKAMQKADEKTIVYGQRRVLQDGQLAPEPAPGLTRSGNVFENILKGETLVPGQFLLSKQMCEKVGGFNDKRQFGEDWEFLLKLSYQFDFVFAATVFLQKRVHNAMQSRNVQRDPLEDTRQILIDIFGETKAKEIETQYIDSALIAEWYRCRGLDLAMNQKMDIAVSFIK